MKTEWEKGRLFGLQVAIDRMDRMKEFWGHEIVRVIARDLCRKNGLPLPEVTPPAAPPPKVTPPWQMPGYDWTMDPLGPAFPSAPPAPASPPPEDCSKPDAAAAASPPIPDSLSEPVQWPAMVGELLDRLQRRVTDLEELGQRFEELERLGPKETQRVFHQRIDSLTKAVLPRLDVLELKVLTAEAWPVRQQPAPPENVVPLHWPHLRPLHPTSGQELKAVLRWTGGQWVVLVEP